MSATETQQVIAKELGLIEDRKTTVLTVCIISLVFIISSITLRLYARLRLNSINFWWDDWMALITAIVATAFLSVNIASVYVGHGLDPMRAGIDVLYEIVYFDKANSMLSLTCIWLIKVSALVFYARIFKRETWFRNTLIVCGVVMTCWWICTIIVPWFNCNPVKKTVDPFVEGVCNKREVWYYGSTFMNALLDLVVLLLPMPLVWRLQMTWTKRLGVTFAFLLGYCSAFLTFARFGLLFQDVGGVSNDSEKDMKVSNQSWIVITLLESPFAVVALSAPAIGQLTLKSFESIKNSSFGSRFSSRFSSNKSGGGNSAHSRRDLMNSRNNEKPVHQRLSDDDMLLAEDDEPWLRSNARPAGLGTSTKIEARPDGTNGTTTTTMMGAPPPARHGSNAESERSLGSAPTAWDVEAAGPAAKEKDF